MSLSRKRSHRNATLMGALIGVIIIFTFVISLINPGARSSNTSPDLPTYTPFGTPAPTLTPTPLIIPTPDADPQLEGALPYVHSSGYFQVFRPAGLDWFIEDNPEQEQGNRLNAVLQSGERLVVIHQFVEPGVEYDSLDSLSQNLLTPDYFAAEWSRYQQWTETSREVTADAVITNFNLVSDGNNFLGRDISWLDNGWLYVARIVVPANNPPLLDLLQKRVVPAFIGYHDLQKLPRLWPAYTDQQLGFVLKTPPGWQRVAGDVGRPATFNAPTGGPRTSIRVWAVPDQPLASPDDASAWLTQVDSTATVLQVEPLQHEFDSGYAVAYSFRDEDGDPQSGLASLLNDDQGNLYIANLHLDTPDLNLIASEGLSVAQNEARQIVEEGFIVLPPDARPTTLPAPAQPTEQATESAAEPAPTESAAEASPAAATESATDTVTETP